MPDLVYFFVSAAESDREKFLKAMPAKPTQCVREVDRMNIHSSVIKVFTGRGIEEEFPLHISFRGEMGVDVGGVYKDMLAVFWDNAYEKYFDGGNRLVPNLHPQIDLGALPILGKIISHGYLGCGFLPVRIAFPTLATLLLRIVEVSKEILVSTLLETVSPVEANALTQALSASSEFSDSRRAELASILGRFGSRRLPTFRGLQQEMLEVARFEFLTKPLTAVHAISSGIPKSHRSFWASMSIGDLRAIYMALLASPEKVLEQLQEPEIGSPDQERVFGFLKHYIGSMTSHEIQRFLHFVTGIPVCTGRGVQVSFNNLSGIGRRPIAHTCPGVLELSVSYRTLEEFSREFRAVLFAKDTDSGKWKFDAV